jgi:3-methyl-2-oxobutanoate hydroxymethyltransferase
MARISIDDLKRKKSSGDKIVVVTTYDAPSARAAHAAGVDCLLVGDSAAMTVLGHSSTLPITMDEMLMLTRAVRRGAPEAFVIADLPFGSYQLSNEQALDAAIRFVKDGGADAVKLERAGTTLSRVAAIAAEGIAVVGHVGLTPQSATALGGYKAQGRTAEAARDLLDGAIALGAAGCFAVVLEAVPSSVAGKITAALHVPTIGIGAGAACDGQVLVWHDLLGLSEGHVPRFVKRYAELGDAVASALAAYCRDVRSGAFPEARHTYAMPADELDRLTRACV